MNQKNILSKCLAELISDKPDISYIRGMLETLIESIPEQATNYVPGQMYTRDPNIQLINKADEITLIPEEKNTTEERYLKGLIPSGTNKA
jgi:hypothetical protein